MTSQVGTPPLIGTQRELRGAPDQWTLFIGTYRDLQEAPEALAALHWDTWILVGDLQETGHSSLGHIGTCRERHTSLRHTGTCGGALEERGTIHWNTQGLAGDS